MTKLIEFPKWATQHTYRQAIEAMLKETPKDVADKPVTNLLVIGFNKDDHQFGILNFQEIDKMIGIMERVKLFYIDILDANSDAIYDSDDE
jgi:hypothetical protein